MTTRLPPTDSPAMRRIILALERGDKTVDQIAMVTFVAKSSLTKFFMPALKKQGRAHVCAYRPPAKSGAWSPVWRAGQGKNVSPPPRQTNTEAAKKYEAKTGRRATVREVKRQMKRMDHALSFAGQFGIQP